MWGCVDVMMWGFGDVGMTGIDLLIYKLKKIDNYGT
jgi:hypothetical protein